MECQCENVKGQRCLFLRSGKPDIYAEIRSNTDTFGPPLFRELLHLRAKIVVRNKRFAWQLSTRFGAGHFSLLKPSLDAGALVPVTSKLTFEGNKEGMQRHT